MGGGPNKPPRTRQEKRPSSKRSALRHATQLVHRVCCLAGDHSLIDDIRSTGEGSPLGLSIEQLDTPALFNWLIKVLSYQGISDRAAAAYLEDHGSITWAQIERRLNELPACPKLKSYWHLQGCGYLKSKQTCSRPDDYSRCPLPKHDLRNGRLNQTAYSLFLFLRDVAESDFVGWIDRQLADVHALHGNMRPKAAALREALLGPLRHIYGVSDKTLSMALATILLAAQDGRPHWHEIGGSTIPIDSLVHNWMTRTGLLTSLAADHTYGPLCYGANGCETIVQQIAEGIDAREFNASFPKTFARFVQNAIWRYCAIDSLDICNGIRIDDKKRCQLKWCRLFGNCARRRLTR